MSVEVPQNSFELEKNFMSKSNETHLVDAAMNLVEHRIKTGKASALETVHLLRLGSDPNTKVEMSVLAWNVYTNSTAEAVRASLKTMFKARNPKVCGLMEATGLFGELGGLGYQVVQLRPNPRRKGNIPGDGEIAILVRNDLKLVSTLTMRMKTFWLGPNLKLPQDPRVYRSVKVRDTDGTVWKIGVAHTPFGRPARAESRKRLIAWAKNTDKDRPTVLVLDANMQLSTFRKTIAGPAGLKATGVGIDLAGYKNAELTDMDNLGERGSDHPAMLYKFKAS